MLVKVTVAPARSNTQGRSKEDVLNSHIANVQSKEDALYERVKARLIAEGITR